MTDEPLNHDTESSKSFRKSMLMADSIRTRSKSKRFFYRILDSNVSNEQKSSAMLALLIVAYWDQNYIECHDLTKKLIHLETYSEQSYFALALLYQMHKRMGKTHTLQSITGLMKKIEHKIQIN